MSSDTVYSILCCAEASASISAEGPFSAMRASLCEIRGGGTEGRAEGSGAACAKEE